MNSKLPCVVCCITLARWLLNCLKMIFFALGVIVLQGILILACVEVGIAIRRALNGISSQGGSNGLLVYAVLATICIVLGTIVSVRVARRIERSKQVDLFDRILSIGWHTILNILAYITATYLLWVPWSSGR